MTKAMPFLQKVILLSYDPRPLLAGAFFHRKTGGWDGGSKLPAEMNPNNTEAEEAGACRIRERHRLSQRPGEAKRAGSTPRRRATEDGWRVNR